MKRRPEDLNLTELAAVIAILGALIEPNPITDEEIKRLRHESELKRRNAPWKSRNS